ncbi:MAG: alpha/beta hydrolase [Gemmatimonadetes bacterium]|nr:alpha/beta hydrolase [Gemmatimonadota bacterium]
MTNATRERYTAFKKLQPRPPRLTRHTVRARGLDFAVFTSPEVPGTLPLLCVNGGMLYSHALLWPSLAPLAASRQVILYDQRGRGATQAPPAVHASRIEFDAGDIPALREALGVSRWDMIGHSWGGGIAMLAAARDLSGVRRLVLVNAVGVTSDWVDALHGDALARLDGAELEALAALDPRALHSPESTLHAEYSRAIYPAYFLDREFGRGFAPPSQASATGAAVAARLRREGYDWRSEAGRIAATTLVVHGAQDVLPARLAEQTASVIPRATVRLIDGAGHMPFWEQPAAFFGVVGEFLDARDQGA